MIPVFMVGVSLKSFQDEDFESSHYYAENVNGDEFEISYKV